MNIANFVIIDDDSKIRLELGRYIRELNAESTVLEFVNSNEFEQRFLLPLAHAATAIMKKTFNPLEAFNPEQVKKINDLTFSKKEPFPGDILSLELKKADFGVIKTNLSTGDVFGQEVVKTFTGNASLEKFLHADFKAAFDNFKKKIENATADITSSIIVKGADEQIWMLEIAGHFKGETGQFQLRNKTYETLRIIGKDEKKEEESIKPQIIDVFIFRGDCVAEKDLAKWVNKIAAVTKKLKLWPENNRPKFIATKFEDDKKEKAEFNHPLIDDLLCLPFDRLIVLQKLELILALPEKATPSYLFVQEIKQNLEVAKKVNIEKFSDLGFAMANPVALEVNTPGHFYFRFPGQKALIDVHGRVTNCLPHPERPKEFLAYFSFFGLTRIALKEIRAYLSRDSGYKMHINQKNDDFDFNPDNIFLTEDQKVIKNVAVIDPDEKTLENINSILRKDIGGVQVITDSSYFNFFRNHLTAPSERTPPAVPTDFYSPLVSFLVGVGDLNLQMCLSPPAAEQKILGHDANQIFATPQGWFDLFKNETSRNLINESIYLVQTQSRLKRTVDLSTADGKLKSVFIELVLEDNKKTVRINMSAPAKVEVRNFEKLKSLDALIIDRRAISTEIPAFINALNEHLNKELIITPPGGPKIIIISEEQPVEEIENILSFKVDGLVFKPLEVKRVCYTLSNLLNIPFTIHNFNNIGWKDDHIPAKLARDSHMIELSEFGATLQMNQKLRVGTMFYLFRGIFQNAPDQNLCCRVYHSVENEGEEGGFLNYVSYFGITDTFLKFTRTYIREAYAGNKAKENASEG